MDNTDAIDIDEAMRLAKEHPQIAREAAKLNAASASLVEASRLAFVQAREVQRVIEAIVVVVEAKVQASGASAREVERRAGVAPGTIARLRTSPPSVKLAARLLAAVGFRLEVSAVPLEAPP